MSSATSLAESADFRQRECVRSCFGLFLLDFDAISLGRVCAFITSNFCRYRLHSGPWFVIGRHPSETKLLCIFESTRSGLAPFISLHFIDTSCTDVRYRPRGHHSGSESPSYENQAHTPTSASVKTDLRTCSASSEPQVIEERHSFKRRSSSAEAKYDDHRRQTPYNSPIRGRPSLKRHQQSISESQGAKVMKTRAHSQVAVDTSSMSSIRSWDGDLPTPDYLGFDWRKDPYSVDVPITDHYIELYFTHINGVTYPIFPRKPFLHWVRNEKKKSSDDHMLVYSILAVGSIFSPRPGRDEEGSQLAKMAQHAVEKNRGKYTLQLAQARILLALYCLSTGDLERAWDYCGLASRAAAGLKLNVESNVPEMNGYDTQVYGLSQHGLAECRRRTFWSIYLTEVSGRCSCRA